MKRRSITIIAIFILACTLGVPASAIEQTVQTEQTKLATIISKGDQEIERRLTALNAAAKVITQTEKLSQSDRQTLTDEISSTVAGLTALKTKLDADTTLTSARADAKSILTQYRVYALVLPKVRLVKVADGQIALEAKFSELSSKFLQRFSELKAAGQNTSALEVTLSNMNIKVENASAISVAIQTKVIALQPSDYNTDHTILSGDRDQLKTAHDDLVAARVDAKTIADGIKALTQK